MMRLFANLFLLMFLVDGGISFLDEITSVIAPLPLLGAVRHDVGLVVLVLADLIYLCLSLDKRLPKRVFLPLLAFVFLCPVLHWFFPGVAEVAGVGLLASAAQVLLLLFITRRFGRGDDRTLLMPAAMFKGPAFSLKNTVAFTAANIVVIPCALVLIFLITADGYMQKYTSGFMRLAPDGLHMSEKIYRRQDKTIRLAGMIHVGEKDYYDKVFGTSAPGSTIVLAEGVSDRDNLLKNRPDYGKLAGYLGLASQQDKMHFKGRNISAIEMEDASASGRGGGKGAGEVDVLRADVDLSAFRPTTVWFLNEIGRQMKESPTLSKQLLGSIAWSDKNITPEMQQTITDDILHRRNQVLINHLRKAIPRYDNILIPWGALHMPEIEQEVLKQGFVLQQVQDSVSIRFIKKGRP